jgi:hypothetical protein
VINVDTTARNRASFFGKFRQSLISQSSQVSMGH